MPEVGSTEGELLSLALTEHSMSQVDEETAR